MRDFGCLGWIIGTIGWFLVWGFCLSIGKEYKISPFFVLLILVAIIFVCVCLYFYAKYYIDKKNRKREEEIKKTYPRAYNKYVKEISPYADPDDKASKIVSRANTIWEQEEKSLEKEEIRQREISRKYSKILSAYPNGLKRWRDHYPHKNIEELIASEDEIKRLEECYHENLKCDAWEKEQAEFTRKSYSLAKELLPNFGRYVYNISFEKTNIDGEKVAGTYKVWQHFSGGLCFDEDLDYTLFPNITQNLASIPQLKNKSKYFKKVVYDEIINFINNLRKDEDVLVYINGNVHGWTVDSLYYHYKNIFSAFGEKDMYAPVLYEAQGLQNVDWLSILKRRIVIIDMVTENSHLEEICEHIIKEAKEKQPLITYISLLKCYSREEVQELIDRRKKEREEKERKRKKIEEQQRKQEEELRKKRMRLATAESNCWPMVKGIHHYFFYYYYPTRFDNITELDWDVRNLIWNFKDGIGHDKVSQILITKLQRVYGEALDLLTFVCIPASTREVNHKRYCSFMADVCNATGMENGYDYIRIVKEKEPTHLGGESPAEYSYDKDFFNGRQIILFDDVVTRGRSLSKMKIELENVGAHIVAALSIGRTYSDFHGDNREPHPWVLENAKDPK